MVRMWHGRRRLTRSTIAAQVVLLPDPVGPVTMTRPRRTSDQPVTVSGSPSWSACGAEGTARKTNDADPRWEKAETRKRPLGVK